MPNWAAFVGLTVVVVVFLLALSRASQRLVTDSAAARAAGVLGQDPTLPDPTEWPDRSPADRGNRAAVDPETASGTDEQRNRGESGSPVDTANGGEPEKRIPPAVRTLDDRDAPVLSAKDLLLNVTVSQAVFGSLLVGGAWLAAIPAASLGLVGPVVPAVTLGLGVGVVVSVGNEVGAVAAGRLGLDTGETLRSALAPDSGIEWTLLLLVALPTIAVFEELLFRAALVGVVSTGYPVSPWLMVVVSAVLFGMAHGAQGTTGMAVTTVLGVVLGTAFVVTGSLIVVVVAHYLVNATEFLLHEWIDVGWRDQPRT